MLQPFNSFSNFYDFEWSDRRLKVDPGHAQKRKFLNRFFLYLEYIYIFRGMTIFPKKCPQMAKILGFWEKVHILVIEMVKDTTTTFTSDLQALFVVITKLNALCIPACNIHSIATMSIRQTYNFG